MSLALTNPVLLPATGGRWRGVLLILAVVAACTTVAWLLASATLSTDSAVSRVTGLPTFVRLLRLPVMRWILLLSLSFFFFSHAVNAWLPEMLADTGHSDDSAGYLAAMSTTVGIIGALTIARLVSTGRRPRALMIIFATLAVAIAALGALPLWLLVIALTVLGFCRAGVIPLLFLEIMDHPDISIADLGAATGLFFAVGEIGGFTGPYVLGIVADRTDGFGAATRLLAVVALIAALSATGLNLASTKRRSR